MTDNRLRSLARRFNETGEGEVAYLRARLAVGELSENQLHIAALCGHAASEALLETRSHAQTFYEWLLELENITRETLVRAGVVCINEVSQVACIQSSPHYEGLLETAAIASGILQSGEKEKILQALDRDHSSIFLAPSFVIGALAATYIQEGEEQPHRAVDQRLRRAVSQHLLEWVFLEIDPLDSLVVELEATGPTNQS